MVVLFTVSIIGILGLIYFMCLAQKDREREERYHEQHRHQHSPPMVDMNEKPWPGAHQIPTIMMKQQGKKKVADKAKQKETKNMNNDDNDHDYCNEKDEQKRKLLKMNRNKNRSSSSTQQQQTTSKDGKDGFHTIDYVDDGNNNDQDISQYKIKKVTPLTKLLRRSRIKNNIKFINNINKTPININKQWMVIGKKKNKNNSKRNTINNSGNDNDKRKMTRKKNRTKLRSKQRNFSTNEN